MGPAPVLTCPDDLRHRKANHSFISTNCGVQCSQLIPSISTGVAVAHHDRIRVLTFLISQGTSPRKRFFQYMCCILVAITVLSRPNISWKKVVASNQVHFKPRV